MHFFLGVFITTLWGESSFGCPEVWLNMSGMHKTMLNEFRLYHIIFRLYQIIFRLYQIILFYFCLYNVYSFLAMSFLHCHHHCLLVLKCHYIHLSSLNVSLFCISNDILQSISIGPHRRDCLCGMDQWKEHHEILKAHRCMRAMWWVALQWKAIVAVDNILLLSTNRSCN